MIPKTKSSTCEFLFLVWSLLWAVSQASAAEPGSPLLTAETLAGDGVWISPISQRSPNPGQTVQVKVWFDKQFLGDGEAYLRRADEFSEMGRIELRAKVMATLKAESDKSHTAAQKQLDSLLKQTVIRDLQRHWIVNGFTCTINASAVEQLKSIPGVRKIFVSGQRRRPPASKRAKPIIPELPAFTPITFDPHQYQHPWYIRHLLADRVWNEFGITGQGTLNIINDGNFVYPDNLLKSVYRNPNEIPANGKDDDGNGYADDCYGYNFARGNALLSTTPDPARPSGLHGTSCAAIICGNGTENSPYEFGIAPESRWAGIIAQSNVEAAIEWAIEQGADTYSMSFSRPNLGELRSHWRKMMEHGSFCGVFFVSGAGNFAQTETVPKQMRIPEDIPEVVFSAAGVQRDLSRTPFSSKGPVEWSTEHYQDGLVQKPEVCAFNSGLPLLLPDGSVRPVAINGNSFAGPMFCGAIALMLSADPDLLPWDLKAIITSTALDVGPPGIDYETGHGLINAYRAVKEVLRRKGIREGKDPTPFTGRSEGDELDVKALERQLQERRLSIARLRPEGLPQKAGLQAGDHILRLDERAINTGAQWHQAVKELNNKTVTLHVERQGKELEFIFKNVLAQAVRIREEFQAPVFE